jgi:hypothetical protein
VTPETPLTTGIEVMPSYAIGFSAGVRRNLALTYVPTPTPPPSTPPPQLREPPPPPPWSRELPTGYRYVICKDCLYYSHDVSYYHCITCHGKARGRNYTSYVASESDGEGEDDDSDE